jgi:dTDP-4-dehydrorhamnose 3,5-epimerase
MTCRFDILITPINGLRLLQRKPVSDGRGYLERLFCADELETIVPGKTIVQVNRTRTTQCGVVRGMHFQLPPYAEVKFVSCLRGEVFDVAVDIRRGSASFLQWHAEILGENNHKTLVIPEGFAHGFQTLTEDCELLYFHTTAYRPSAEGRLNAQDPRLAIQWPLTITELSSRDAAQPMLTDEFAGITL